jgi:hypothetical protein
MPWWCHRRPVNLPLGSSICWPAGGRSKGPPDLPAGPTSGDGARWGDFRGGERKEEWVQVGVGRWGKEGGENDEWVPRVGSLNEGEK